MGIFQEQTYAKFGKHPSEALFYNVSTETFFFFLLELFLWGNIILIETNMVSNDVTLKPFKYHNGPLLVRSIMVGYRTESKIGHSFDLESFFNELGYG